MSSQPEIRWPPGPPAPRLDADAVHLWCTWLDDPDENRTGPERLLSDDERQRARRLRFDRDRRRFIVARATLRRILAQYLEEPPERLRFTYGPSGKPALDLPVSGRTLEFNLSHSGPLALYAAARRVPLGVDIERIRTLSDLPQIAERFFAPSEAELLHRLPPADRTEPFFRIWTRREALAKACEAGLDETLRSEGDPARLSYSTNGYGRTTAAPHSWTVTDLQPASGYAAALTAARPGLAVKRWQWISTKRPAKPPAPNTATVHG